MEDLNVGPLYPKRAFVDTELSFLRIKLLRSGGLDRFGPIVPPDYLMSGAICGIQVAHVPNRKKGVEFSQQLLSTAFFIAPGVAVTAWHVLEGFLPEPINGSWDKATISAEFQLVSPLGPKEVLIWPVDCFSVGATASEGSDLTAIGCHLSGPQPTHKVHHCLQVSDRFPAIGEKLHMLGLKEPSSRAWNSGPILLDMYESVGDVTDVFPKGRGKMPMGPCFAVSTGATGGMSGSPVFDNNGVVIGILSTGVDDQSGGYSIVSSIASVLDHRIRQSWCINPIQATLPIREILAQA